MELPPFEKLGSSLELLCQYFHTELQIIIDLLVAIEFHPRATQLLAYFCKWYSHLFKYVYCVCLCT